MRLNKFIAHSGYCSRRVADTHIAEGIVTINSKTITSFNTIVTKQDDVRINGQSLIIPTSGIWLYHKPIKVITSREDNYGRATIFQRLPKDAQNLISIGRLDYNSEGLLLLTNNGDVAKYFMQPQNNIPRKYRVKVFGQVSDGVLQSIRQGITIDGHNYKPIDVVITRHSKNNAWLLMTLTEGKNREIRNILEHLGLKITRLIRIEYGEFKLGNLAKNALSEQMVINNISRAIFSLL